MDEAGKVVGGTKGPRKISDNVKVIDGKVGGKVPVEDFNAIRKTSIKNPDTLTLGKYTPTIENGVENWAKPGTDSYITKGKEIIIFRFGQ